MTTEALELLADFEPLDLEDLKSHCNIWHDEDDRLLERLRLAAIEHAEAHTQRAIYLRRYRDWIDGWCRSIDLGVEPVRRIERIEYRGPDSVEVALPIDRWYARPRHGRMRVRLLDRPALDRERPEITITYLAGYGADPTSVSAEYPADYPAEYGLAGDVVVIPEPIRQAVRLLVGHWYENREAVVVGTGSTELPLAVDALLQPYRRLGI